MTPLIEKWGRLIVEHRLTQAVVAKSEAAIGWTDGKLQHRRAWLTAALALLVLQAALILTHWPWLDEWQALQIAVQSPDLAAMMHNLTYEGHPPLWYLILRWTALAVPPLWVLAAVALVLALVTQALILFTSPFTRAERLLVASSQFVMFEMLTVSRSFTLGTMLIVLALALWQRRRLVWLPIALLPMCDFLYGVASIILIALLWRRDRSLFWPGVALWLAIGLAAAWSVRPAPDVVPALVASDFAQGLGIFLSNLGLAFLPLQWSDFGPVWNSRPPLLLLPVAWIGFVWFAWVQTRHDRWNRLALFCLIGVMLAICMSFYLLSFRHVVLVAVMLIAFAWIDAAEKGRRPDSAMRLWLLAASACGLFTAAVNFVQPFDRAHVAAAEIERLGLGGQRWLAFPLSQAQGLPALTGIEFENPTHDCVQSFVPWISSFRPETTEEATDYLRARVAREGRFYLATNLHLGSLPPDLVQEVARIAPGYDGFAYNLYLVGPNAMAKQRDMPPCVPGTLPLRALPQARPAH